MITVCRIALISIACTFFGSHALGQQDVFHGCAIPVFRPLQPVPPTYAGLGLQMPLQPRPQLDFL